jgi:hypothetical protein
VLPGPRSAAGLNNTAVSLLAKPDGELIAGGSFTTAGGENSPFIARYTCPPQTCYANCDNSTVQPILNVSDFSCFLANFAAGNQYANCDASVVAPVLNVNDFTCFMSKFSVGCP